MVNRGASLLMLFSFWVGLFGTTARPTNAAPPLSATPTVCFTLEPSTAGPGDRVIADGDCPGLLHHRFLRIFFDSTLVTETDFGGGRLFTLAFTVPETAMPGIHTVTVKGPFLDASTAFEVPGQPCPGDCDLDGRVRIGEVVIGTGIALGQRSLEDCPASDADGDARVAIEELTAAVRSALKGCE